MITQTFTTTLGNHTLNLVWASGETYAAHVIAYNSAAKEISIYNMGWGSSVANDWLGSASPWSAFNYLPTLTPDLTIIDLTINDAAAGTDIPTYKTALQSLITNVQSTGDIILMSGSPIDPIATGHSLATQQAYVDAMKAVALSANVPMIDTFSLFGSTWAGPNASGWMFSDGVHPDTLGYTQIAGYVNRAVAAGFKSVQP
jgi:lysophospholipase L1-like esterase